MSGDAISARIEADILYGLWSVMGALNQVNDACAQAIPGRSPLGAELRIAADGWTIWYRDAGDGRYVQLPASALHERPISILLALIDRWHADLAKEPE